MHGSVFLELYHFYSDKLKEGKTQKSWFSLLQKSGLTHYQFFSTKSYPDEEMIQIIHAISIELKIDIPSLLEEFGKQILKKLLNSYSTLIKAEWKSLDLIENTENVVHTYLRLNDPNIKPPFLKCKRLNTNSIEILYDSPRKLCHFAKGLIQGIGIHYKESLTIEEPLCMHKGSNHCLIVVKKD